MKYDIYKIFPSTNDINKIQYDTEGLYSITHFTDADIISKLILSNYDNPDNLNIIDCNASIGGNTISFSKYFKTVTAVEINQNRYNILNNNINIYKLNNINTILGDCINLITNNQKFDVFFFDPPWGGLDYKNKSLLRLKLDNYSLKNIINLININEKLIVFKLPFNYDFDEFSDYNYKLYKIKNYYIIMI
jgi:16S rRNA G966 N2-methylase RsmD